MIESLLAFLYDDNIAHQLVVQIKDKISSAACKKKTGQAYQASDVILITYGDQFRQLGISPLSALNKVINEKLAEAISGVHLLPFYPSSSDGGFSVIDYNQVDPAIGCWEDLNAYRKDLMFDAVFNHISAKSEWFEKWKQGDEEYRDFFIAFDRPDQDHLDKVIRPRALPLLTPFETSQGKKWVWTTFSQDQIDLNLANPKVLEKLIDTFLLYLEKGAKYIRIDAVPFFWKELGTSCAHHPKTHALVKLLRAIVEELNSQAVIITESNVPHLDNISYFGNGYDEAHMVYNFSMAPLIWHANLIKSAKYLHAWSSRLDPLGENNCFFNFTATHDGIGLMPLKGILAEQEIDQLCQETIKRDGRINYKFNSDGSRSAYEATITWASALKEEGISSELWARKVVSSHLAMASFPGVPGVYIHNFLGTLNWLEGVENTAHNRDINRRKFTLAELEQVLLDPFHAQIFSALKNGLAIRRQQNAFAPLGPKIDFAIDERLWSFLRISPDQKEKLLVVYNLSDQVISFELKSEYFQQHKSCHAQDLLEQGRIYKSGERVSIAPFGVMWLRGS